MIDKNRSSFLLSFLDMVFAMLLAVSSLFVLSYLLITVKEDDKKVDSKAEYLITMTWDDKSANDIDLWVLTPEQQKIGFPNRQNQYMGLERDDLGLSNDTIAVDPRQVGSEAQLIYKNIETITIRAVNPGRYVVNVHFYSAKTNQITGEMKDVNEPVEVQLIRVNPSFSVAAVANVTLEKKFDVETAFSFEILPNGDITNISYDEELFVYRQ